MSIRTSRSDSSQIIRLESDMVRASDEAAVKDIIEKELLKGTKNFVFSVSIGTLANRPVISRLLLWCREKIWHEQGTLVVIEKNDGGKSVFGSLCEILHIPLYQNIETVVVESSTGARKKDPD